MTYHASAATSDSPAELAEPVLRTDPESQVQPQSPTPDGSWDVGMRYLDQRNRWLEEESQLYVARHTQTGAYATRIQRFLSGNQEWMKAHQPSVQEVRDQLASSAERFPMWTDDVNRAETWMRYNIDIYRQYVPEVEFVPVTLTVS